MNKEITFHLEVFDGPLDLLLHLIAKNKVEIKDIPISLILAQYLDYLNIMREFDLDIAADFIAMAAQLMLIKSKMLLPVHQEDAETEDPRNVLVQALLEYQRYKAVSSELGVMSHDGMDLFVKSPEILERDKSALPIVCTPEDLLKAMEDILGRAEDRRPATALDFTGIVEREPFPVMQKLSHIISLFKKNRTLDFEMLVMSAKSRSEVVAIFLAVLELSKDYKIYIEDKSESGYTLSLREDALDESAEMAVTHG